MNANSSLPGDRPLWIWVLLNGYSTHTLAEQPECHRCRGGAPGEGRGCRSGRTPQGTRDDACQEQCTTTDQIENAGREVPRICAEAVSAMRLANKPCANAMSKPTGRRR